MLATSRRLPAAERSLRKGSWEGKEIASTGALQCGLGGVLLVLGFGTIGGYVAQVGKALGMTVLGQRRSVSEVMTTPEGFEMHPPGKEALHALLPRCSHLVITCPLTEETRGLIGAEELALLPSPAVVVNVGRAEVIAEDAMWAALQEDGGTRLGFGSDVWWSESSPNKRGAPGNEPAGGADEEGVPPVFPSQYPMHERDNVRPPVPPVPPRS